MINYINYYKNKYTKKNKLIYIIPHIMVSTIIYKIITHQKYNL